MTDWNKVLNYLQPKEPLYCPEEASLTQKVFLRTYAIEALFGGAAGGGKGVIGYTPIWTPFGPKRADAIEVGDQVINPEGGVSRIVAVYKRGFQPCYRVSFSDGASLETDADHLWRYRLSGVRVKRDIDWKIATTPQLKAMTDRAKTQVENDRRPNWPLVPLTEPVQFTVTSRNPEARWPIDPYVLGVLLGDGCLTKSSLGFTSADEEIVNAVTVWANQNNMDVVNDRDINYRITQNIRTGPKKSQLRKTLEVLDVCHRSENKKIPDAYLIAPLEIRQALVQGLMDTDGTVDPRGHAAFTTVSKQLALDVQWLTRSLGYKATITERTGKYRNTDGLVVECQTAYTIQFSGRNATELFRLRRKRNRCLEPQQTGIRRIVSIERILDAETVCFTVDHPNGLFVAGDDFVVTHNSSALLMAALQYVDVPNYSAILFRRTFADLSLPGALMDRAREWFSAYDEIHWNANSYIFTFPSGARISFGYLNNTNDYLRYKGAEFQFIGMDEVTEIRESDYRYLFSRLRRPASGPLSQVPLRMRAASNPAPNWVRQRFIVEGLQEGRIFVPSKLTDNPGIDAESYQQALQTLDPIERRRLESGDWWATTTGSMFSREAFVIIDAHEVPMISSAARVVRFWDLAASEPSYGYPDPDWTVGVLMLFDGGVAYVLDVRKARVSGEKVEALVAQTAQEDGHGVAIRMEQEPGSAGKALIDQYARYVIPGYDFMGLRSTGDKETRARPFAAAVANGNVRLVRAPWLTDFLDEFSSFPEACAHDDQVDATVGAFTHLAGLGLPQRKRATIIV